MNCNKELHDELKESGDIVCPFCDQKLEDSNEKPKYDECCDNQYIINDDGMLACLSCGIVQGYNYVKEYVNFYENRHKFLASEYDLSKSPEPDITPRGIGFSVTPPTTVPVTIKKTDPILHASSAFL